MKSIGARLGRWEKAKWGNFWDWIKIKMMDTSFTQVGRGSAINMTAINMTAMTMRGLWSLEWCPCFEGPGKREVTLFLQRYVYQVCYPGCKGQQTGLVKVKMTFVREHSSLGQHDYRP